MEKEKNIFRKIFRRVIWENLSTAIILIGVFMLLQPFQMFLYTYSFIVILAGTIGFVITSHFPD
jgi:flagellar motor component MotA